jgi:WD40 repeat protein
VESHADDVTKVKFNPYNSTLLMSGSIDGMLCVFDLKNI